ncbi:hypothetical protein N0V84_011587 [Fusarium piperis]|uniref:Uncharacterized protein n=1 Tax=Fusarium piperis TaxID=1435070 RepID=A0A9W8TBU0_9HYPO|nr:hypothetical protein N0V84_011587 [Fusarium piperis]
MGITIKDPAVLFVQMYTAIIYGIYYSCKSGSSSSASIGPTIGLFLFAWTARKSIHWIAPTIGITIYGVTVFIVMQCIFVYIPLSYPMYAASLFAANDFFRSALACGSVLFAQPLFDNLGVAKGTSLLGGLSVIGIIGIWLLYFYGARLRALSKFAIYEHVE